MNVGLVSEVRSSCASRRDLAPSYLNDVFGFPRGIERVGLLRFLRVKRSMLGKYVMRGQI
jgi:hypothetical protein